VDRLIAKKILVVYNTCGISGKENSDYYAKSIESILEQDFCSFDVVVSSCLNSEETRDKLLSKFSGQVKFNFIDEIHPVNVTFNHSVMKSIERYGEYSSYMYVDSGTTFVPNLLNELNARMETGRYGMVTPQPENDTEYFSGLGVGRYRGDDEYARSILFKHGDYLIPIGKGMGTHTNLISEELRKYYGKVYPDIFASHCTESTFSFLNAGLKKQWLLMKDFILPHQISLDGQSSGFSPAEWQQIHKRPTFDHPYKIESILKRLLIPEAIRSGFGYEECRDILKHDKAQFDDNYHCVNEDLKKFLKSAVFLTQEELNYDTIKYRFID
jgi:hypothetical protein|tara:strand:+ start:5103 stop:6083 length:981 start_codon:yes stop_codon:yes gene_type:complete